MAKKPSNQASTIEGRTRQITAMVYDLAEEQAAAGTMSSQVMSHFLKLETQKTKLEEQKLAHDVELLQAKTEQIRSGARLEELYKNVVSSLKEYNGHPEEVDD